MKTLIFQHTKDEVPGTLEIWLQERRLPYHIHHTYLGQPIPMLEEYSHLVILGGPMNVDEEDKHPWLRGEKDTLRKWIQSKRPTLGICLGAQMVAQSLGGRVTKNREREIGFFEVEKSLKDHPALRDWPEKVKMFQYHEDTFSLPAGADRLLFNSITANQAFAFESHVLGFQFHPEATKEWIYDCYKNLKASDTEAHVQPKEVMEKEMELHHDQMKKTFFRFLDHFWGKRD